MLCDTPQYDPFTLSVVINIANIMVAPPNSRDLKKNKLCLLTSSTSSRVAKKICIHFTTDLLSAINKFDCVNSGDRSSEPAVCNFTEHFCFTFLAMFNYWEPAIMRVRDLRKN